MRRVLYLLVSVAGLYGATASPWLEAVDPILKPAEKKAYLGLTLAERTKFEEQFWAAKSISAQEYFRRVEYIDATFGSERLGSGANTDQGRVYLAIGPPVRIKRIPSSRIFVPIEIWYYDIIPGLIDTEVRLMFYQKNSLGFPKLYSPELDTIRALMLPQAGTIDLYGPNDTMTESSLRMSLNVPPAEDEVVTAAVNVATGIRTSGNGEIIGQVLSPASMLTRDLHSRVQSRLVSARPPKLDFLLSKSPYSGLQVDMALEALAQHEIGVEVVDGPVTVYHNTLTLKLDGPEPLQYLHRLDLLPGSYRIAIRIDGKTSYYPLEVPAEPPLSDIILAAETPGNSGHETPFEFGSAHFYPSSDCKFAVLALPQPEDVTWVIRRGLQVVWRKRMQSTGSVAVLPLPFDSLTPGKFELEATADGVTRRTDLELREKPEDKRTLVSLNANLLMRISQRCHGMHWLVTNGCCEATQDSRFIICRLLFSKAQSKRPKSTWRALMP